MDGCHILAIVDYHFFRINYWSLIFCLWQCRDSSWSCSFVLVSMHLKKQSSLPVFTDWLWQEKLFTIKPSLMVGSVGGLLLEPAGRASNRGHGPAINSSELLVECHHTFLLFVFNYCQSISLCQVTQCFGRSTIKAYLSLVP